MGYWEFNIADPSNVRVELTQRDQFNNDEVSLAHALVREVIQNSSDASNGAEAVKVRFAIKNINGVDAQKMAHHMEPLRPHMRACDINLQPIDDLNSRLLVIEDFNTKGLTGRFDEIDGGNFDSFWRAFGKSEKSGKSGGRWGLGKLVYSSSSKIHVFYGLTVREGDSKRSMMGQAVLKNHRLGENSHPAHGFWFANRAKNNLQLPVDELEEVSRFTDLAGVTRTDQTGLSIIIPYLVEGIDENSIISGVISNYYFPILAGKLVIEVGDILIDKDSFLEVAAKYESSENIPFDFVKAISNTINHAPEIVLLKPITSSELDETFFDSETVLKLKNTFSKGDLVHIRVPVTLKPKNDADVISFIDLYLKGLNEGSRPFALFARGPITLPGERRYFGAAVAQGALIANDDQVAAFLGDAENPAHTSWNPQAEKLEPNWRNSQKTLSAIRHSLKALYHLIADQAEAEDVEALVDFFSILDKNKSTKGPKKKAIKPKLDLPVREKAINIKPRKGGFDITAGPGAANWSYPKTIRLRLAYDMIGANPFNRHSIYDFNLLKGNEIQIQTINANSEPLKANVLKLIVTDPEFAVEIRGFDEKRDVVVDARAL